MRTDISDKAKKAFKSNNRRIYWTIKIDGTEIDGAGIVAGSITIKNQISDGQALTVGNVYAGELSATLLYRGTEQNPSVLRKKKAEPFLHIMTEDGTYEKIAMGTFRISSAKRRKKTVEITAYDAMVDADTITDTPHGGESLEGAVKNTAEKIGGTSGGLGTGYAAPSKTLTLPSASAGSHKMRDELSDIASYAGGNFIIDAQNRLRLIMYREASSLSADAEIRPEQLIDFTGSDYTTGIGQVSVVNSQQQELASYGSSVPQIVVKSEYITEDNASSAAGDIYSAVNGINYSPFTATITAQPYIEIGDTVNITDADGNTYSSFVTSWEITSDMKMTISCAGEDPAIAEAQKLSQPDRAVKDAMAGINTKLDGYDAKMAEYDKKLADFGGAGGGSTEDPIALINRTTELKLAQEVGLGNNNIDVSDRYKALFIDSTKENYLENRTRRSRAYPTHSEMGIMAGWFGLAPGRHNGTGVFPVPAVYDTAPYSWQYESDWDKKLLDDYAYFLIVGEEMVGLDKDTPVGYGVPDDIWHEMTYASPPDEVAWWSVSNKGMLTDCYATPVSTVSSESRRIDDNHRALLILRRDTNANRDNPEWAKVYWAALVRVSDFHQKF